MRRLLPLLPFVLVGPASALLATAALAQTSPDHGGERPAPQALRRATALRLPAGMPAPVLDGRLDDAAWALTEPMADFTQREPHPGQPALFQTIGRIVVTDDAVYAALEAIDPEPERIVGRLTRRDQMSSSDWLALIVDSDHDRRTAFMFLVNPREVKVDAIVANGQDDDLRWDAVWDVEVEATPQGWIAEFRIPLSMLRFSTDGEGIWGIQLGRIVQRVGETSFWAPVPPQDPNFVNQFGEVRGFQGLRVPRRLELLPYMATRLTRAPGSPQNPFFEKSDWDGHVGLDLEYGVTSNLTLNATVNPDFGQVEADPSEVNLTAFETFFEERRPFFVQGADIFQMPLGVGDGDVETLFYTRRIGRAPQGSTDTSGSYVDAPFHTSILGAVKLSGRSAGRWTIGAMNAITAEEEARIVTGDGARSAEVVEPLTSYAVARLGRDLREGATRIGFMGTAVNRRLDGTGLEDRLRSSAYSGGAELTHRFASDQWRFTARVQGTTIVGSEAAITRAQLSSARYFQRPDVTHVAVDSAATSMSGWASTLELMKESGGSWRAAGFLQARSPGFEPNDIGFMRETDYRGGGAFAGYRILQPVGVVRRGGINVNGWTFENFGGLITALGGNVNGNVQFTNFWRLNAGVGRNFDNWSTDALRGGPNIREPGNLFVWFGGSTDDRKNLQLRFSGERGREDDSGGTWHRGSVGTVWQVSGATRITFDPFYRVRHGAWQYVAAPRDDLGAPHYVFADIDQRTFGLVTRVEHTFTPRLSLQLYTQPFVSAGAYSGFKEVVDPRARRFEDRFGPVSQGLSVTGPDFNVREFDSNLVARWEYRPGSTMFFVWQQRRESFDSDPRFRLGEDLGDLFGARPRNIFLVKVNGWLNL